MIRMQVQSCTLELAIANDIEKFKAFAGWLRYFIENTGFSFRRITYFTTLLPEGPSLIWITYKEPYIMVWFHKHDINGRDRSVFGRSSKNN